MPFSACKAVIERLSAVVDGHVGGWERCRLQLHLAICPPCRRYHQQLLAVRALGSRPQFEDLPDDIGRVLAFALDLVEEPSNPIG